MDEILIHRIDLLLKNIDLIISDTHDKSYGEFAASQLLIRATCFSIEQICEQMNSLEKKIGKRYPDVPWSKAIGMRIMIAHVYSKVEPEAIYKTVINDIPALKEQFLIIKNELSIMDNN